MSSSPRLDPKIAAPAAEASPAGVARGGASDVVLRTEGLTVRFGGLTALNRVDFQVRRD